MSKYEVRCALSDIGVLYQLFRIAPSKYSHEQFLTSSYSFDEIKNKTEEFLKNDHKIGKVVALNDLQDLNKLDELK